MKWQKIELAVVALLTAAIIVVLAVTPELTSADEPVSGAFGKYNVGAEAGDPIYMNSGAYGFSLPLLSFDGPLPLNVALSYRNDNAWIQSRYMSTNFQFGVLPSLSVFGQRNQSIEIEGVEHGELIRFGLNDGGTWVLGAFATIPYSLTETPGFFYLLDPAKERLYIFEKYGQFGTTRIRSFQDRNGNRWTYTYTSSDWVPSRMEDGLGRSLQFTYTNVLGRATDHGGRAITFTYAAGELAAVTDPLSQTTRFDREPVWPYAVTAITTPLGTAPYRQTYANAKLNINTGKRVTTQVDAYGNTTTFAYDPAVSSAGTRVTETNALSHTVVYLHKFHNQNNGPLSGVQDATGQWATYETGFKMLTTGVADRTGNSFDFSYDADSGKPAGLTNPLGNSLTNTYALQEQAFTNPISPTDVVTFTFSDLTRRDYPDGANERFAYDGRGNLLSRIDQAGQTWTYAYNARGQITKETNPAGGVTDYTYDARGNLISRDDSDTGATTFTYDTLDRVTQVTRPDSSTLTYVYDANDRVTSFTDERGNITTYTYDANGNLTRVTDGAGSITTFAYDAMDRRVQSTDRLGNATTFTYDPLGRLKTSTDPAGVTTQWGYDARGWLEETRIGASAWRNGYDAEGRVITRTTPLSNTFTSQRDAIGYVSQASDPLGGTTAYTRDSMSRLTSVTDPLSRTTTYAYDSRGLLSGAAMPVVGGGAYTRTVLGDLSQVADTNGRVWSFDYTPMGRIRSTTDPLGRTAQYTYDTRGRLSQGTFPDGATVAYTYDAAGNLTRTSHSDGADIQFTYDALNRQTSASGIQFTYDAEGRIVNTESAGAAFGATYDAAGRLKTATYPRSGGTFVVTYSYDAATGLLTGVSDNLASGQVQFAYDADFRPTTVTRGNGVNTTLTWDNAARVTRIQDTLGAPSTSSATLLDLQYTLDAAGQVAQLQMTAPLDPADALAIRTDSFTYDDASQLTSAGYSFDVRGRSTASPGRTYSWDGASRLVSIGGTTLAYNGLGDLATRAEGGTTIRYLYNGAIGLRPPAAERNETSGEYLRYYVWSPEGRLLYMIDAAGGNNVYYYHFDRTGSTLALTGSGGTVTDAYAYMPYGEQLAHQGSNPQPFTFVGEYGVRQEGSGALYQMRARYYDARAGRFLSRDPLWPQLDDPRQLNPYQYAAGEPVRNVDPTGLDPYDMAVAWYLQSLMRGPGHEPVTASPGYVYSNFFAVGGSMIKRSELDEWVKKGYTEDEAELIMCVVDKQSSAERKETCRKLLDTLGKKYARKDPSPPAPESSPVTPLGNGETVGKPPVSTIGNSTRRPDGATQEVYPFNVVATE